MLLNFIPEFIGVWIAIVIVVLTVNVIKSHYSTGLNLLEITRYEALFNRMVSISIFAVVFFAVFSIVIRSRRKYGGYFWPAALLLGCIVGGVFWMLYVYSESHTLIERKLPQIVQIVIIPGALFSGLCGGLSTFLGFAINSLTKMFTGR